MTRDEYRVWHQRVSEADSIDALLALQKKVLALPKSGEQLTLLVGINKARVELPLRKYSRT
jgi:phage protein D